MENIHFLYCQRYLHIYSNQKEAMFYVYPQWNLDPTATYGIFAISFGGAKIFMKYSLSVLLVENNVYIIDF